MANCGPLAGRITLPGPFPRVVLDATFVWIRLLISIHKNSTLVLDEAAAPISSLHRQCFFRLYIIHKKEITLKPKRRFKLSCPSTYSARVTSPCALSRSIVIPKSKFWGNRFTASRKLKIGLSADWSRKLWTQVWKILELWWNAATTENYSTRSARYQLRLDVDVSAKKKHTRQGNQVACRRSWDYIESPNIKKKISIAISWLRPTTFLIVTSMLPQSPQRPLRNWILHTRRRFSHKCQ